MTLPKLSETLAGPRDPESCQGCGGRWLELSRWWECDEHDQPTDVVLVMCARCVRDVVTPHARLYRELDRHQHHPGSMPLCRPCRHRDGLGCRLAGAAGPGVEVLPRPSGVWIKATRRALSGLYTIWRPATSCSGRQVLRTAGDDRD